MGEVEVDIRVNNEPRRSSVPPRVTLADYLREQCGLTGTHLGCEHGVCGACTILLDGEAVRSCLMFAVQADGQDVTTVEGLASPDGLHPVQREIAARRRDAVRFLSAGLHLLDGPGRPIGPIDTAPDRAGDSP